MKKIVASILAAACTVFAAHAQTPAETFGTIAETWDAEISPDGKHLALGCSPQGVPAICIYTLDSDARPRLIKVDANVRLEYFFWPNADYLIYAIEMFDTVKTSSGLRDYNFKRLVAYNLETGNSEILLKNRQNYVSLTNVSSLLEGQKDYIQIDTGAQSFKVNLKNGKGKREEISQRGSRYFWRDQTGEKIAEFEWYDDTVKIFSWLDKRNLVLELDDVEVLPFDIEGLGDGQKSVMLDFKEPSRQGLHELSLIDGSLQPVSFDGEKLGNVETVEDRFTNTVVGYGYTKDLPQRQYLDETFAKVAKDAKAALNADSVVLSSWTKNRQIFVVRARDIGTPEQFYIYDTAVPSISPIGSEAPWLGKEQLSSVFSITYDASDGLEIPAYLTLPPGKTKADGPFPLVLLPHGGPESRDTAEYDWLAQALASQGYVVLQPNFRGSAGYGVEFRNAGFGEFGGKMVTDVINGANYLVSQGIAKPGGYCSMGWSYGGYSSLMIGLLDAQNAKCLISINGVTNPAEIAEGGRATFAYWEQYMGDIYKTSRSAKREISPLDRASEYRQPILLIHGKEDTTVEYDQSRALANKVPSARLVTMPGDDHGMYNTASRRKIIEESLAFLAEHLPID